MFPTVVVLPHEPLPQLSPKTREELLPRLTGLLAYVLHANPPVLGIVSGYLAECARIVGRVSLVIGALTPVA